MFNTESEVIAIIKPIVTALHPNVQIRVGKSSQGSNTLNRIVTFFVIIPVSVNRDTMIKAINNLCLTHDRKLYFSGSESGLLYGDVENDWLFITTEIMGV